MSANCPSHILLQLYINSKLHKRLQYLKVYALATDLSFPLYLCLNIIICIHSVILVPSIGHLLEELL